VFNKLVVSTNEKRGNRTARFFFGTSIIYLVVVACAFAISILIANPKLADTSEAILLAPSQPPPPLDGGTSRRAPQTPPRQDPNNVRDLDHIMTQSQDTARRIPPQSVGPFDRFNGGEGVEGGDPDGVPGGLGKAGGVPEGHDGEAAPPPRPPDPPKPTTQARAEDNKQPLRLTSTVLQGKASVRRTPDYPPLAKQIHLEGSVSVEVMIAPDGRVESARAVSSSHPMFVKAAVDSAYGWRFEPTTLNGTPVRVTGIIVFNFKLN
jgi:TonB family protein